MPRIFATHVASVLLIAMTVVGLVGLAGCQKDIPPEGKSLIGLAATAAQERSAAFDAIKAQITASDPANAQTVAQFVEDHSVGLKKQADAFSQAVKALDEGSKLTGDMRAQLQAASDTAIARKEDFDAVRKYITAPPEVMTFLEQHAAALAKQADTLSQLAGILKSLDAGASQ